MTYAERAESYCRRVLEGDIPACKWTKAAARRHLDDLSRSAGEWPYYFDADEANRWCRFVEKVRHIKGKWKSPTIILEDWQCFLTCCIFGWRRKADQARRFRIAYLEVARKNAKSTWLAAIGLALITIDKEAGAEVYSLATTRDQAKAVWKTAQEMAKRDREFCDRFQVNPGAHSITVEHTASLFQPLSSEADTLDGLNVHGGLIDELHAHPTRAVWDVIETATGSRQQPLIVAITTAGTNRSGICYEQRTYVTRILNSTLHAHGGLGYTVEGGTIEDETYFGVIYTLDDDDMERWWDEKVWVKSNPNYGVSVLQDDMKRLAKKAMQLASAQPNFLTKRLNVWVNAESAWMNMVAWEKATDRRMKIEDFAGWEAFVGMDLASKTDITSMMILFRKNGEYRLFGKHYLPSDTVEESGNASYRGWASDGGPLIETEGNTIDESVIEADLLEWERLYRPKIAADPGHGWNFFNRLSQQNGTTITIVPANVMQYSEPMKELEALILRGKLKHDGNPVLTWMVSSVVCKRDDKDNIYPKKEREENKIDGVVATIIALGQALKAAPEPDYVSFF